MTSTITAIQEMHNRIDTLSSQIERAEKDAADCRVQAARFDDMVATWGELRQGYREVIAAISLITK